MDARSLNRDQKVSDVNWGWIPTDKFFDNAELEGEIWRPFSEFNSCELSQVYYASNKGRIKNSKNILLLGSVTWDGYHSVNLTKKDGSSLGTSFHKIILTIFKGCPPEDMPSPTVQHINHDKLDNRIENLVWMSAFDNNQEGHGTRCKLVDSSGGHIFESQKAASIYIGRHPDYISEGIGHNYKMTKEDGSPFEVYIEYNGAWVKYYRKMPRNRKWCRIVEDGKITDFDSFQQCNTFLNLSPQKLDRVVNRHQPIPTCRNIRFYIYDIVREDYIEYVPDADADSKE